MYKSNAAYIRTAFPITSNPTDLNYVGWFDEDEVQYWRVIMPKFRVVTPKIMAVFKAKMVHLEGALFGYGDTEDAAEAMLRKNIERLTIIDRPAYVDTYCNAITGSGEIEGFRITPEKSMSLTGGYAEGHYKVKYVGELIYAPASVLKEVGISLVTYQSGGKVKATFIGNRFGAKNGMLMETILEELNPDSYYDWQVGEGDNMVQALHDLHNRSKDTILDGWNLVAIESFSNALNIGSRDVKNKGVKA